MRLSRNFDSIEFMCRDGTLVPDELMVNVRRLAQQLQVLRDYFNRPIVITSGYRTPEWNTTKHAAKASRHMTAEAADIRIKSISVAELSGAVEHLIRSGKMLVGGVGTYHARPGRPAGWLHVDVRVKRARWSG